MSLITPLRVSFYLLFFHCLFTGCQHDRAAINHTLQPKDMENKRAFLTEIQYPAGTSSSSPFLPFPANHGICAEQNNLEVVTIAPRLTKNDKVAVYPLGVLLLKENNTPRPIIVASPIDTALQIIHSNNYRQFLIEQSGMHQILQDWYFYEKGLGKVDFLGWQDEQYAWQLILD